MEGQADLLQSLREYIPSCEQEASDRKIMISCLESCGRTCFFRDSYLYHFTASSWIVNRERTKTLLVYHNIYDSWSWTGGHADGEENLLETAVREAKEETGIEHLRPVSGEIFSIEIITVDGHEKHGEYVPSHVHFNVTYLMEADENDELQVKKDENSAVGWFDMDRIGEISTEKWMIERIYGKLISKLSGGTR